MKARAALLLILLLGPLAGAAAASDWLVVQYDGPVPPEEQAFLAAHARVVLDHVPPFGWLVALTPGGREALEARPAVLGVHPVPPESRLAPDAWAAGSVRVLAYPDADPARLAAHLLREGAASARASSTPEPVVDVTLGRLSLAHLLAHPETRWVEPLRAEAGLDAARASSIAQSGRHDDWSVHARGVNGSSQLLAYCDTGLDTDAPLGVGAGWAVHELFADPLAPLVQSAPSPLHRKVALHYSPVDEGGVRGDVDDAHGHGTHMAGILAGDAGAPGARDGNDGVAPAARLVVCDAATGARFHVLADFSRYWRPAYDAGARVHSNSWGTTPSDQYLLAARQHDAFAWQHRDFLVLRSMGNSGPDGLMRPEAAAKNVLAVGATRNDATDERVEAFSARGPASDGRVKPDLVAPGACVTSASIGEGPAGYACLEGTSQATAVAAGAATLVRDYYAKGYHPTGAPVAADARSPSSALVRATLVAGAVRVAAPAPDAAEGWGRVELDRALAFAGTGRSLVVHDEDAPLRTGDAWVLRVTVPPNATLRVALAWTDHPAAPGATVALVNDLDLEVVAPGGAVLLGNLAAPDRRNVVERVEVPDAAQGEHVIRVRGWSVPMGPQPFAVAVVVETQEE